MRPPCAPVIIATLNRSQHFIRLIESLKLNTWAKYTDIYIGLDYPPSETYVDGYNHICAYLSGDFPEFASFNVIKREVNVGSISNFALLRDYVLNRYDRFIRTDDDAEFSPNFLEYMNKCLDLYENDENVIAVSGYSYPINWRVSKGATVLRQNFIAPMWGTGFWRSKYSNIIFEISTNHYLSRMASSIILNGGVIRMSDICRNEFVDLCLSPNSETTLSSYVSDISLRMYLAAKQKYVIIPAQSKVRNWGFDGSGEFCLASKVYDCHFAKSYPYHVQPIDEDDTFTLIKDSLCDNKTNKALMNDFDPTTSKQKIKVFVKALLFVILGRKIYTKLTLLVGKLR